MVEVLGSEAMPDGNAAGILLPHGKRIGADQDGRVQGPRSIDQRPSHDVREPEEKLEHRFFVRMAGIRDPQWAKKKGPAKFTDPFEILEA